MGEESFEIAMEELEPSTIKKEVKKKVKNTEEYIKPEITNMSEHAKRHMTNEERAKLSERFRGEKSNFAKLTSKKVTEIRALFDMGISPYKIGPMFNVDSETARQAAKRITWKHVL